MTGPSLVLPAQPVQEVVEDLLGHPPLLSRQTEAHAPVGPLDHPPVPHVALVFAQGVRRIGDLGVCHTVSFTPNYDGQAPADGGAEGKGSVNPVSVETMERADELDRPTVDLG